MKRLICLILLIGLNAHAALDARDFKTTVGLILTKKNFKTVCSGVLLQEDVVLTAAHCLTDLVSVRVINDFQITRLELSGVRGRKFWGKSWLQHPLYNGVEKGSVDLGLIFLNRKYSSRYDYVEVSQKLYKDIEQAQTFYRIGFGKRPSGNRRNVFQMSFNGFFDDYMTAKDTQGMGGDSGGPVYSYKDGHLELIGVHCGRMLDGSGHLENISYLQLLTPALTQWIQDTISDAHR